MKVLLINEDSGKGSTGRICEDLVGLLIEGGNEGIISYGRSDAPQRVAHFSKRITNTLGVYSAAIQSRLLDNAGFAGKRSTKEFIRWVEAYDPDVIHLHNLHGYYIHTGVLFDYLKKAGKPVIWTLHDCWAFTGHAAVCENWNCEKWETGCGKCPALTEYPSSLIDRSIYNWKKKKETFTGVENLRIVTPSFWLRNLAERSFLRQYPMDVIRNGINLKVFHPRESDIVRKLNLEGKKIVLGVASPWVERKGFNDFMKLSEMLSDRFQIVMVGMTQKQMENLPSNITGIERTHNPEELADLYSAAEVFVNPTYADNYPTTNIEAVACGTPVLTYRTGGSPESVPEENVVEQGDVKRLCELIESGSYSVGGKGALDKNVLLKQYIDMYTEMALQEK